MPLFDDALFDGSTPNSIPFPPVIPSGYLGRFQQGMTVPLSISPVDGAGYPTIPDQTPTVTVTDPSSTVIVSEKIAMTTDQYHFGINLFLGFDYTIFGRYNIEYSYVVAGHASTSSGSFDLVGGGDGAGKVISLISYQRPEANYIVAQTEGRKLMQGKNPQL